MLLTEIKKILDRARDKQRYLTGGFGIATSPFAEEIISKMLKAVDGAGLKDEEMEVVFTNMHTHDYTHHLIANAQLQAIKKAIKG